MERLILYFGFLLCLLITDATFAAQLGCTVDARQSDLAIDQRDDLRMKCLRKKVKSMTLTNCLKIAQTMEYTFNSEDARVSCLEQAASTKTLSFEVCQKAVSKLSYADSADEARWLCLRQSSKKPTQKQCLKMAGSMDYPSNSDRAELYCRNELR